MRNILAVVVAGGLWLGTAATADAQFALSIGNPYAGGFGLGVSSIPYAATYGGGLYGAAPYAPYGGVPAVGTSFYSSSYYGAVPAVPLATVAYPRVAYPPYYGVAAYPRYPYYGGFGPYGYGYRRGFWGGYR